MPPAETSDEASDEAHGGDSDQRLGISAGN
jgi:hypothetical protein